MEPDITWRELLRALGITMVAFVVAIVVTGLVIVLLPFTDFSAQTPGRVVIVFVFYTTVGLIFAGDYWQRNAHETSEP